MDLMQMWTEMGLPVKALMVLLVFLSMWSFGVAIERLYTYTQARKQSKLYAPQVAKHLKEGRLTSVLDAWQTPPMGIYAVFPQRRHLPMRVRLFIDLVKEIYGRPCYWELE